MAATYKLIASQTLGTTTSSVTFSSIPNTYTDLVLRVSARDTYTNTPDGLVYLQINSSTNSYSDTVLYANGSNKNSYRNTAPGNSGTESYGSTAANATANAFGSLEIYIPNYAGSTKKVFYSVGTPETNASSFNFGMGISASLSSITDPITQLVVKPSINFVTGSTFYLYGVEAKVNPAAKATGGTISYGADGYTYHAFTTSGTFTPTSSLTADVLLVAGGGGGGGGNGGGGGAGGLAGYSSQSLSATAYTVTVGAGGNAGDNSTRGTSGGSSGFTGLTSAVGGGGGGSSPGTNNNAWNGSNGGSGGGGGKPFSTGTSSTGGTGTAGQGNSGGTGGRYPDDVNGGGGGGGAGGAGVNAQTGNGPANGGVGSSSYSVWGSATGTGQAVNGVHFFAGGGAGFNYYGANNYGGTGGNGGGGSYQGGEGTANTGGGGSTTAGSGANGGSGIVIVRYVS
jgi:hypothetical protein